MLQLSHPLRWLHVTCTYNEEYPERLKNLLQSNHMGIDFRTDGNKEVLAMCDGKVDQIIYDDNGGNMLRILSDYQEDNGTKYEVRFAHLEKIYCKVGDKVRAGYVVAMSGNTGKGTSGHHLHVDVKNIKYSDKIREVLNYGNGLKGCIEFAPMIGPSVGYAEWLPIDEFYGIKRNWLLEFTMRFKTPLIHRYMIKIGRKPASITNRETTALAEGGWNMQEVFDPAMWPVVAVLTKKQYNNREKVPIRLTLG